MMRQNGIRAGVFLLMLILLSGCGRQGEAAVQGRSGVDASSDSGPVRTRDDRTGGTDGAMETGQTGEAEMGGAMEAGQAAKTETDGAMETGQVLDLRELSPTVLYAEVCNMMYNPQDYIGKKVIVSGSFGTFHTEGTDTWFYACVIRDVTLCCQQGLEFIPEGTYVYPEDFPESGTQIEVEGVFDTYEENGQIYPTLRHAVMTY